MLPSNRIVVDYKGQRKLILLTKIHTQKDYEFSYEDLKIYIKSGFDIAKKYDGINDLWTLKQLRQEKNKEGFVVKFKSGMRVKIKFDEYVRLHRIITQVSNKSIWECLKNDQSLDEILERVPDEFYNWVKQIKRDLNYQYLQIQEDAGKRFDNLLESKNYELPIRKEYASWVKQHPQHLHAILFRMYDKKEYSDIIWKMIKPKYEKPFKKVI